MTRWINVKMLCLLLVLPVSTYSAIGYSAEVEVRQKGSLTLENIPVGARAEGKSVALHQSTTETYYFMGYDLDGRYLYLNRDDNIYKRLHRGSAPRLVADTQLSLDGANVVRVCGKTGFVFTRDTDGDEYDRVYLYDVGKSAPVEISSGVATNRQLRFNDSREKVVYASAAKDTGIWKLIGHSFCGDTSPKTIFTAEGSISPFDWSPDGQWILAGLPGNEMHQLVLIDANSGKSHLLFESKESLDIGSFSADGKKVFFSSRHWTDNRALFQIDIESGNVVSITGNVKMDVENIVLSDDRKRMAIMLNQHGFDKLLLIDAVNLTVVPGAPERSIGVIGEAAFDATNNVLAMSVRHPSSTNRTVVYNIEKRDLSIWTGGFRPGQKLANISPQIIQYPSFDTVDDQPRQIPAILYLPNDVAENVKLPVLIDVHGGPSSQASAELSLVRDYNVAKLGIAVIEPNIRGSSGYGRDYQNLDNGYLREDSVKDIGALLDWIAKDERFDADRVAIRGGSYGGYVTLAALARYGNRLRAGIDVVGISDFTTFLENTEAYRVENRRLEYGDERDPEMREFLDSISPLRNADKILSPLLIVHGALDPRVPVGQAEKIRDAVRENGVPVWYMVAADEGHGFRKGDNAITYFGASSLFLQKYLLDR